MSTRFFTKKGSRNLWIQSGNDKPRYATPDESKQAGLVQKKDSRDWRTSDGKYVASFGEKGFTPDSSSNNENESEVALATKIYEKFTGPEVFATSVDWYTKNPEEINNIKDPKQREIMRKYIAKELKSGEVAWSDLDKEKEAFQGWRGRVGAATGGNIDTTLERLNNYYRNNRKNDEPLFEFQKLQNSNDIVYRDANKGGKWAKLDPSSVDLKDVAEFAPEAFELGMGLTGSAYFGPVGAGVASAVGRAGTAMAENQLLPRTKEVKDLSGRPTGAKRTEQPLEALWGERTPEIVLAGLLGWAGDKYISKLMGPSAKSSLKTPPHFQLDESKLLSLTPRTELLKNLEVKKYTVKELENLKEWLNNKATSLGDSPAARTMVSQNIKTIDGLLAELQKASKYTASEGQGAGHYLSSKNKMVGDIPAMNEEYKKIINNFEKNTKIFTDEWMVNVGPQAKKLSIDINPMLTEIDKLKSTKYKNDDLAIAQLDDLAEYLTGKKVVTSDKVTTSQSAGKSSSDVSSTQKATSTQKGTSTDKTDSQAIKTSDSQSSKTVYPNDVIEGVPETTSSPRVVKTSESKTTSDASKVFDKEKELNASKAVSAASDFDKSRTAATKTTTEKVIGEGLKNLDDLLQFRFSKNFQKVLDNRNYGSKNLTFQPSAVDGDIKNLVNSNIKAGMDSIPVGEGSTLGDYYNFDDVTAFLQAKDSIFAPLKDKNGSLLPKEMNKPIDELLNSDTLNRIGTYFTTLQKKDVSPEILANIGTDINRLNDIAVEYKTSTMRSKIGGGIADKKSGDYLKGQEYSGDVSTLKQFKDAPRFDTSARRSNDLEGFADRLNATTDSDDVRVFGDEGKRLLPKPTTSIEPIKDYYPSQVDKLIGVLGEVSEKPTKYVTPQYMDAEQHGIGLTRLTHELQRLAQAAPSNLIYNPKGSAGLAWTNLTEGGRETPSLLGDLIGKFVLDDELKGVEARRNIDTSKK